MRTFFGNPLELHDVLWLKSMSQQGRNTRLIDEARWSTK